MNGSNFKKEIERVFETARKMCPGITDDMLDSNGAIFYMNGNDTTAFDWNVNDRLCEFMIFHKNEMGFIKVCVNRDSSIDVCIYEDGGMSPTCRFKDELENLSADRFADLMYYISDRKLKFDRMIDELDWDVDLSECCDIDD